MALRAGYPGLVLRNVRDPRVWLDRTPAQFLPVYHKRLEWLADPDVQRTSTGWVRGPLLGVLVDLIDFTFCVWQICAPMVDTMLRVASAPFEVEVESLDFFFYGRTGSSQGALRVYVSHSCYAKLILCWRFQFHCGRWGPPPMKLPYQSKPPNCCLRHPFTFSIQSVSYTRVVSGDFKWFIVLSCDTLSLACLHV